MSFAQKIRVGVLRGGPSPEYEISLNTGRTILANLPEEYEPLDIFISKKGAWHIGGLEKEPRDILKFVDVAVNAMHGSYGEDGTVQKLIEGFGIPYTGSNPLSSAIGLNKEMSKNLFKRYGLKTPHHIMAEEGEKNLVDKINESLPFPVVVKPVNSGSSLGVSLVRRIDEIKEALIKSFAYSPKLIVEEYVNGREAACGVIEGFRGQNLYTLLPAEIAKSSRKIIVPGNFREDEKTQIQKAAALIHQALNLRHYSQSDFIIHPKRGLFVLEVNTLPELTHRSSFLKALEAVGGNIKEFLSHLLSRTLNAK